MHTLKTDNRVVVYVEQAVLDWLRSEHERHGAPVGEIIRRALRAAMEPKAGTK